DWSSDVCSSDLPLGQCARRSLGRTEKLLNRPVTNPLGTIPHRASGMLVSTRGGAAVTAPEATAVAVVPGGALCRCTSPWTCPFAPAAPGPPPAYKPANACEVAHRLDSSAAVSFGRS